MDVAKRNQGEYGLGIEGEMQNAMSMAMLVSAALAAMAFGVMLGYAICKGLFTALRLHARSIRMERSKAPLLHQP